MIPTNTVLILMTLKNYAKEDYIGESAVTVMQMDSSTGIAVQVRVYLIHQAVLILKIFLEIIVRLVSDWGTISTGQIKE